MTCEAKPVTDYTVTKTQLAWECFGTFFLCYGTGLSVMQADLGNLDLTGVGLANWLVLAFIIYAGAAISGANYNAAVSLALAASNHIGWVKCGFYCLAQFIGSLIAGIFLVIYRSQYTGDNDVFKSGLGFPHVATKHWSIGCALIMEMVATFTLVMMVYMTAVNSTKPKTEWYGLAIGGALGIACWTIGPMTGAGLNPWRCLGPAIVTGELFSSDYSYAWIYYLGNSGAGLLTGFLWKFACQVKDVAEPEGREDIEERLIESNLN